MIKTKKALPWPTLDALKDAATKAFGDDLGQILTKAFRDVYDDLFDLTSVERVTVLPSASVDYRGQLRIVGAAGVQDKLKICVREAAGTYSWKEVTL